MNWVQLFWGIFVVVTGGLFFTCGSDPCEQMVLCENGTCLDGDCVCEAFYDGAYCESEERAKFLGGWQASEICNSGPDLYPVIISEGNHAGEVIFDEFGPYRRSVYGQVNGDTVVLPMQAYGQLVIEGAGGIDSAGQAITVSFSFDDGGLFPVACLATLR